MIDQYGLIVDKNGDGGDSCNFTSCALYLGVPGINWTTSRKLFWNGGMPVRHPFQKPWDNPLNFTRDQAVLLMRILDPHQIKTFLDRNPRFFPNIERDAPGSKKLPYPHRNWKDSRPYAESYPFWQSVKKPEIVDPSWEIEFSWGNYADIMTPDFTAMARVLAHDPPGSSHMSIAKFFCRHAIEDHCNRAKADKDFVDFKQLYFTAKALGLHRDFAAAHPWGLHYASWKYFTSVRELPEIDQAFMKEFKSEGILE